MVDAVARPHVDIFHLIDGCPDGSCEPRTIPLTQALLGRCRACGSKAVPIHTRCWCCDECCCCADANAT